MKAVIFDLDGTLVQTEILKAKSYARAAASLCPGFLEEREVVEAFKEVVGLSRHEVAKALLLRFDLEEAAKGKMAEYGVSTPWQAFVQVRMDIYESMISDGTTLHKYLCPHNEQLLHWARQKGYFTGLATMSHCPQASNVLRLLDLEEQFDFVATRDDVTFGKPDPEIYTLVARELDVPAEQCLVIEDSLNGVKAALAAGMPCLAVTTDFTSAQVHTGGLLDPRWIVDEPGDLLSVAEAFIKEHDAYSTSKQRSGV